MKFFDENWENVTHNNFLTGGKLIQKSIWRSCGFEKYRSTRTKSSGFLEDEKETYESN